MENVTELINVNWIEWNVTHVIVFTATFVKLLQLRMLCQHVNKHKCVFKTVCKQYRPPVIIWSMTLVVLTQRLFLISPRNLYIITVDRIILHYSKCNWFSPLIIPRIITAWQVRRRESFDMFFKEITLFMENIVFEYYYLTLYLT